MASGFSQARACRAPARAASADRADIRVATYTRRSRRRRETPFVVKQA
jgi:hypothetical protein